MTRAIQLAVTCLAVLAAGQGQAAMITLDATDSGWYDNSGSHNASNSNYIVRINGFGNMRNFLVFDLSTISEPIVGATLRLQNPQSWINNVESTYSLFDVSTSVATLTSSQSGAPGLAVYSDLGTGSNYGSILVDGTFSPGIAEITLNSNALADLNLAAGDQFAVGGALSTPSTTFTEAFGNSGLSFVTQLVLQTSVAAVPEPSSLALFGVGACVAAIGVVRRRRRVKQSAAA